MSDNFDKTTQTIERIEDTIFGWLTDIAPRILENDNSDIDYDIPWVMAFQNGSLPNRPFGTIKIDDSPDRLSMQNVSFEYDQSKDKFKEQAIESARVDIDLMVFGHRANTILKNIFLTIGTQEVKDYFFQNGIRYNYRSKINNVSAIVNKKWEERAHTGIILHTIYENVNYIDRIVEADVDGTFTSDGGTSRNVNIKTRVN